MKRLLGLAMTIGLTSAMAGHTLPLDKSLIRFSSPAGQALLKSSQHKASFWKLMPYFVTERGLAWCAVATDVMVLNALNFTPPPSPMHAPHSIFEQTNFFNAKTMRITVPSAVFAKGVSLGQNAKLLEAYGATVKRGYSDKGSYKQFHQDAVKAVSSTNSVIIVNFCRKYMKESGCGHFSPLAAYNKKSDRFLLLDVARYKYPPVWVKASSLYHAMGEGVDGASKRSRGYLVVSK